MAGHAQVCAGLQFRGHLSFSVVVMTGMMLLVVLDGEDFEWTTVGQARDESHCCSSAGSTRCLQKLDHCADHNRPCLAALHLVAVAPSSVEVFSRVLF